jgi:uncharacterized protein (TIGR02246 family)
MRLSVTNLLAAGLLLALFWSPPVLTAADQSNASVSKEETEAVRAVSKQFETDFNAGNAQALGLLFGDKAEVVDADGNVVQGRDAIVARFQELLEAAPGAKIEIDIASIRQLSSDVAVEDGRSITRGENVPPGGWSPYSVVYVKQDGKWLMARVRDFPEEAADTPHDHLLPLEWLLGEWVDESDAGRVETKCAWTKDGNYLLQHYKVIGRRGNTLEGVQRIGWDAVRRTIRSWTFDNSGGFVEATWTQLDDGWIIKAEGSTPAGEAGSTLRRITPLGVDLYQIESTAQSLGGESFPDSVVRVVRRPPPPAE